MADLSIYSRVLGMIPDRIMTATVFVASSIRSKTAHMVRTALGKGIMRRMIRVITPSVPSEPVISRVMS